MSDKFGIYAWPAYNARKLNPCNYLIYHDIENEGFKVFDFYLRLKPLIRLLFSSRYKILHVHWPHHSLLGSRSYMKSLVRIKFLSIYIKIIKFFGKKIVYTVHNLEAHENRLPGLQRLIDKILYHNVDGFISMNHEGIQLLRKKIKFIRKQKIVFIPHPHYKDYYPNNISREEARKKLLISDETFVFLFLGQIRTYKNLPNFIDAFNALDVPNKLLVIAGHVHIDLTDLNHHVNNSPDIKFYNSFVKDDDIQVFLNAADVVVTPYSKIFNSGSVFLNLSFNKPTLAPDIGAFRDLQLHFGSQFIKTYQGDISPEILEKTMKEVKDEKLRTSIANLEEFAPEVIAEKTISFYKSLL